MNRMHGDHLCDNCRQPSEQKWLYICSQDTDLDTQAAIIESSKVAKILTSRDVAEADLHHLNVSASIISQWQNGTYSASEIELVKNQKRRVTQTIGTTSTVRCTPNHSSYSPAKKVVPHTTVPKSSNSTSTLISQDNH